MNNELYTQFDGVFFEKTRLSMMTILYKEKNVSFNRFKKIIGASDGAIYTHLQKLQDANYIDVKKQLIDDKAQTICTLTVSGKKIFKDYIKFLETTILKQ
ncbi:MAG: transcriptional regulator [Spirochaetes bacterium]|nr:transcriptional regulator [Spirochaetota bacterium]